MDPDLLKYVIGIDPKNARELFLKIKKNVIDENNLEIDPKNLIGANEQLCDKKKFVNNYENFLKNI